MFSKAAIVASLLAAVSAHQNLHQFWVNDVSPGYEVAIRKAPSNSPVTDLTSNDITCNVNGNTVPSGVETTPANAGDTIKVQWDSSSHPGPIQHYLFGPVDDAAQATGIGSWFKIDEFTQTDGKWANEIMLTQNMTYEFKLPTGLPSGDYLLRSEMLALHGSQTLGGGQFYMGCMQLKVTGSATETCTPSVELPGAYSETDPGIYIPNVYNGFDITTYVAPGGDVAVCGAGSGSAPASSAVVASSTSAVVASSSSAVVAPSSSAVVESSSAAVNATISASVSVAPASTTFAAVPTTLQTVVSSAPATSAAAPVATSDPSDEYECS
ncbi:fungal cellulose binding domain-containing protein [Phlyctema vagabunda]|uniref:AA9 family lytic polysaccharide monooxygenase n=1 Tax=Phlyctema vagabunda TaxID=108571 RepID=A0ABR4PYY3_9HELO